MFRGSSKPHKTQVILLYFSGQTAAVESTESVTNFEGFNGSGPDGWNVGKNDKISPFECHFV